jgi:hypothetical protein
MRSTRLPQIDSVKEEDTEECTVADDDEEEHINYDDHHKTNGHLRYSQNHGVSSPRKRGGLQAYNNPAQNSKIGPKSPIECPFLPQNIERP